MSEREKPPRELVQKLERLGPEKVVDGYELCPQCDGLSPGIHMDGETVMHCNTCQDQRAVTVEAADPQLALGRARGRGLGRRAPLHRPQVQGP